MIHNQNVKKVLAVNAASTTNGGTASGNIDTLGFDFVQIDVLATTADVVSNKPTVLKIGESDDTVVTNFADVTGFVGGTSFTIPNAVTAATSATLPVASFNVDTRARKRYLKVSVSPQTTQNISVLATLSRAEVTPTTSVQGNVVVTG